MKRIVYLLILLTGCSGCGSNGTNEPTPPTNTTQLTAGVQVGIDSDVDPIYRPELFAGYYQTASDCMVKHFGSQYQADPGPVVRVVTFRPNGWSGWTSWVDGQITIQASEHHVMLHEAVHYLLWREGEDNSENEHHLPAEIFNTCGPTNDGMTF